jgi:hypothetical protein
MYGTLPYNLISPQEKINAWKDRRRNLHSNPAPVGEAGGPDQP